MKKSILVVSLTSVLLLSGCVISIDDDYDSDNNGTSWAELEEENREKISLLSVGASINSVRRSMGTPDFDELLVKNEQEHRILFYRTQRTKGDGTTTKDECTPIIFLNGELIGFGQTALDAI
ncbi:DUF3192 domain-containing protein [Glaciecola petra]|uniref:DUF3192 domain-containing protein n=1 Tax=Glaciecola petra TaxID=3075602 RepID=A0ABU2ZM37_9ALTE|nr:DUF3192 domain-containing protein [Aestuariibacter sp. P117]MDT0593686.1 DUF3192 domain-containing protein [Aestuariibacter sp. P117]